MQRYMSVMCPRQPDAIISDHMVSTTLVDTREVVVALVPKYARGKALDIGGGSSKYRTTIGEHVSEYVVADLYEPGVNFKEDVRKMTFPDESFDTVLSFQVLEHVDDTVAAVSEIYRVLKLGGCAIVTVPFLFPQHGDPSDFNRFTKEGVRYHFERAGFTIKELGHQGSVWSVVMGMLRIKYLNHYQSGHGRLRRAFFARLFSLLKMLDRQGFLAHPDIYANVYVVAQK
ncbi:MAG: type 11 methyltransferase [Parcubacteria group bacterium Greene0714_7]|nr:MAG: type 11 methyltransferase [Parcubacteria group bacterium Greene0714_7]